MSSLDDIVTIVEFHRRRWKPPASLTKSLRVAGSLGRCDCVMNVLTVVMRLCKCQIQFILRKLTDKGITVLFQNIYNSCTIAILANQLNPDIKLSMNVNAFKKMLKSSLLVNYKF